MTKKPTEAPKKPAEAPKKPTDALKKASDAEKKAAKAAAEERIARAEQRIRNGNATREEVIADCKREKKKHELAKDVIGALAWSLTAMGLGQGQPPKRTKR
jgi:hypothetical protein